MCEADIGAQVACIIGTSRAVYPLCTTSGSFSAHTPGCYNISKCSLLEQLKSHLLCTVPAITAMPSYMVKIK